MLRFLSSSNEIVNASTIEFKPCSSGLAQTEHIYILSDVKLTAFEASTYDNGFGLFKLQADEILDKHVIGLDDVEYSTQQSLHIYKLNLLFEPETESSYSGKLSIETSNGSAEFMLYGETSEIDERLVVVLQNFKKFLDDDYVTAFRESVVNSNAVDAELYNRKVREYLLNIHDLVALRGSYKSLFAAMEYFGYGEMLALREYWVSNGTYKSTPIGNAVLTHIDKSLAGFKKTNQMSLTYQISEEIGRDEDGLPIYRNVIELTDDILMKMRALQRVLEKDFLSFNTHIVDIIGEFQAVVGVEMLTHLNNLREDVVDSTTNIRNDFAFSIATTDLEILNHKVIVKPWLFEAGSPLLQFIQTSTSAHVGDFFVIERELDEFEQDEMLTKYLRDDFGLLKIAMTVDEDLYQLLGYEVYENGVAIYQSGLQPISDMIVDDELLIGIRKEGEYKISFSLVDYYGSRTFFGSSQTVKVSYKKMRIKLGHYGYDGDENVMDLWTTFKSTNGHYVPSAVASTLDVNTWNASTNIPSMILARTYSSDYDMLSTYSTLNNLNNIKINDLDGQQLISWADSYFIAMINCYDENAQYAGFIYSDITADYEFEVSTSGKTKIEVLSEIIQLCNASPLSNEFTFDLAPYADDNEAQIEDALYVIRMKSINASHEARLVNLTMIAGGYEKFMAPVFSNVDAKVQFAITSAETDDLIVKVGDVEVKIENAYITNTTELLSIIEDDPQLSKLLLGYESEFESFKTVAILSADDIMIEHASFGKHVDVARAKHLSRIYTMQSGSDVQIGKPVFACIDNAKKSEVANVKWTLIDSLIGHEMSVQNAFAFRYVFNREGVYSLKCEFDYHDTHQTMMIDGFVIMTTT